MCYIVLSTSVSKLSNVTVKKLITLSRICLHSKVTSQSAESGDSGIVVAVVIVVVLIVIAALVAVYILDKRNKWKLLDRLRASVTGGFGRN